MPLPSSGKGPRLRKRKGKLIQYLKEFEEVAKANGLDDAGKKKWVTKYVEDKKVAKFWRTLPGYNDANTTFDAFKTDILKQYPSVKDDIYTIHDLEQLTTRTARLTIDTEDTLLWYYHRFQTITQYLVHKAKTHTNNTISYQFWKGLPQATRHQI